MTKVTYTFDPPLSLDDTESAMGSEMRRLVELAVVDQVIREPSNKNPLRALVARSLGYNDLAEKLDELRSPLGDSTPA